MEKREKISFVANQIVEKKRVGAITGAGISVESGIPDFRSSGGLWERYDPMEYATIEAFRRDPHKVWKMLREMDELIRKAKPNPAHHAMARLEELGFLKGLITQNVDNLHQAAGSKNVIEFHGNGLRLVCLQCRASLDANQIRTQDKNQIPPLCPGCLAVMKPDVVFFGEIIPPDANRRAMELAQTVDLFLVIGTSATIAPASYVPLFAKRHGALLVEINLEPTALTEEYADISLIGQAGIILPELIDEITKIAE